MLLLSMRCVDWIWPDRPLTQLSARKMTCSVSRARICGRCEATVFRLQRCGSFESRSERCSLLYTRDTAQHDVRIQISRLCEIGQRPTRVHYRVRLKQLENMLVPFRGVVARVPNGGVCPISVHLPEPHFFAVSDSCRKLTHDRSMRSIFAPSTHVASVSRSSTAHSCTRECAFVRAWGADLCSSLFWWFHETCLATHARSDPSFAAKLALA